jgi:hypothetical protein
MKNCFSCLSVAPASTPAVANPSSTGPSAARPARAATPTVPPASGMPDFPTSQRAASSASAQQGTSAARAAAPVVLSPPQLQGYGSGQIAGYSAELMGYELLKTSIHEKPTGKSAELLERGQKAVDQARAILLYGRENIGSDQLTTGNESVVRLRAARQIKKDYIYAYITSHSDICPDIVIAAEAASASMTQAGNCDEFAAKVYVDLTQSGLQNGESIERKTYTKDIEHAWTELKVQARQHTQEQRVVADPWTSGPSALAEDSLFGASINKPNIIIHASIEDAERAKTVAQFMSASDQFMRTKFDPDSYINHHRAQIPPGAKFESYSQNPIPNLSKSFIDKTQQPQASHLTTQIQAIGVLRKSDDAKARVSVQEAVALAPQVVDAAQKLRAEVALHELQSNLSLG